MLQCSWISRGVDLVGRNGSWKPAKETPLLYHEEVEAHAWSEHEHSTEVQPHLPAQLEGVGAMNR